MIRIFKNLEEYNTFTNNGQDLVSGDLYWVEDNKSAFFLTNNIDGYVKKYDMLTDGIPDGYIVPSGNIEITENGENIDVAQYATASVNVASTGGGNEDLINLIERDVTTFDIPQGTTKIGDYAFYHYSGIGQITIPDTVTNIGEYAFGECTALTTIKLLATTPPNILKSTLGNPGDHFFFVPNASLDAYRTATNWVNYANYIFGRN